MVEENEEEQDPARSEFNNRQRVHSESDFNAKPRGVSTPLIPRRGLLMS
jgi:hypothetical protein